MRSKPVAFVLATLTLALAGGPCLQAAERGTLVRDAIIYLSPDAESAKLGNVERGRELIVLDVGRAWLHVEALFGPEKTVTGWIQEKGVVRNSTPQGDLILFGEAANSEDEGSRRHGRKGAADDARRLYYRVYDYFPNSPVAGEALYRAADIQWQIDRADVLSRPSAREQEHYLREGIDEVGQPVAAGERTALPVGDRRQELQEAGLLLHRARDLIAVVLQLLKQVAIDGAEKSLDPGVDAGRLPRVARQQDHPLHVALVVLVRVNQDLQIVGRQRQRPDVDDDAVSDPAPPGALEVAGERSAEFGVKRARVAHVQARLPQADDAMDVEILEFPERPARLLDIRADLHPPRRDRRRNDGRHRCRHGHIGRVGSNGPPD